MPLRGTRRVRYIEDNVASADVVLTDADRTALDDAAPAGRAVGERYPAGMLAALDAS